MLERQLIKNKNWSNHELLYEPNSIQNPLLLLQQSKTSKILVLKLGKLRIRIFTLKKMSNTNCLNPLSLQPDSVNLSLIVQTEII